MSREIRHLYEFDAFRLDPAERQLLRDGAPVPLTPKAFDTLVVLVERSGHLVEKEELMNLVWAEAFVEEANLARCVHTLRKALGEEQHGHKYIETVPKRGYRFVAEVQCVGVSEKELAEEIPIAAQSAKSKISPQPRFNVERKGNILAPADWQAEREGKLNESFSAPTNGENILSTVLPAAENKIESPAKTSRRGILLTLIAVAAFGGLLTLAGFVFLNSRNKPAPDVLPNAPPAFALKRLTPDQNAINPVISPDGKYLVYSKREDIHTDTLWLKDMTSGSAVQIMPRGMYRDLAFSPDGTQVYYGTYIRGIPNGVVVRIPVFGGKPQEMVRNFIGSFAISPDGKRIAVFKGDGSFTVIDENGRDTGDLLKTLGVPFYPVIWGSQMSWSADGERVVLCGKGDDGQARVLDFSVKDRTGRFLPIPNFSAIDDAAWLADGSGLLVTAKEKEGEPYQIWRVAYPSGEGVRITNDFNNYDWISLSQDSKTLVVQQQNSKATVWLAPFGDAEHARQLTFGDGAQDGYWGLAFAPDGKIIFTSPRSGDIDLWTINADGANQQPLTANEGSLNISPRVTPDGRYIVFASSRNGGALHIWRMDTDGRNPLQLTHGANGDERYFDISPDGNWIYYAVSNKQKPATILRVSINGGEPVGEADSYTAGHLAASPDGKLLARYVYLDGSEVPWRYGIFPIEGGEPIKLLSIGAFRNVVRWSADGKSLVYMKAGTSQLWRQPIDDSPPTMLMDFKSDWLFNFAVSPDYKQIVFSRGNEFSEAVLIDNFGKL